MKRILLFILTTLFVSAINAQTLFSEDFEGDLSAWELYDNSGYGFQWQIMTNSEYGAPITNMGEQCLVSEGVDNWIYTAQPVAIPSTGFALLWYDAQLNTYTRGDQYSVYVSSTGNTMSNFTASVPVMTVTPATCDWTFRAVDLSPYAGQSIYIAFSVSDTYSQIKIDDIEIFKMNAEPEVCLKSLDMSYMANVGDSLNVSGSVTNFSTATLTRYDVTYNIEGGSSPVTHTVTGISIPPCAMHTFSHSLYISAASAGDVILTVTVSNPNGIADNADDNTLTANVSVCGAAATHFPITQDFENGIDCWTQVSMNTENTESPYHDYGVCEPYRAEDIHGGLYAYAFCGIIMADNYSQYLISPELSLPRPAQCRFFYKSRTLTNQVCRILVSTTTNDVESFEPLDIEFSSVSHGYREASAAIQADVRYIAIEFIPPENSRDILYIDDITISLMTENPEIAVTGITAPPYPNVGDNIYVSGVVSNNSASEINSYSVAYSFDGILSSVYTVSGVNIAAGETHTFTHDVAINNIAAGHHTLTVTVSNPNGTADNTEDNSMTMTVTACDPIEDFTYTESFDNPDLGCWQIIDADNDGDTWIHISDVTTNPTRMTYNGSEGCLVSVSDVFYYPDDWLISPPIALPAMDITMAQWHVRDTYRYGRYSVYIGTSRDTADLLASGSVYEDTPGSSYVARRILLDQYVGQTVYIAFRHDYGGPDSLFFDEFSIVPVTLDPEIALIDITVPLQAAPNSEFSVSGTIVNNSASPLSSYDIACTVNGQTVERSIEGLNIAYAQTRSFTITMPVLEIAGDYTVTITVSNPNGQPDITNDNTRTATINIWDTNASVPRITLLEQFSTAYCNGCPYAHASIEEAIGTTYTENLIWVTHHSGYAADALTLPIDETLTAFYNGTVYAPAMMVDRTHIGSSPGPAYNPHTPAGYISAFETATSQPAFVTVNIDSVRIRSVDYYTRLYWIVELKVHGMVTGSLGTSDPRLNIWLVEDSLLADGQGLVGHGPVQNGTNEIFYHNHVLRANFYSNDWGIANIVNPTAGTTYRKTTSLLIPQKCDISKCYVVAFVSNGDHSNINDCRVFNAGKTKYLTEYSDEIQWTITVRPDNIQHGTTTGSGTYTYGQDVVAEAIPSEGWEFLKWDDGSVDNPYIFRAVNDLTLTAIFQRNSGEGIDNFETQNSKFEINIFPNPTDSRTTITCDMPITELTLCDLMGRSLTTLHNCGTSATLDLSAFAKGLYLIKVKTSKGMTVRKLSVR